MINNLVKIVRFDNYGFNCKPYNSSSFNPNPLLRGYHHSFEFIDEEIVELGRVNQCIKKSKVLKPIENDWNWSGCFCFLEEYDENIASYNGILSMRQGQKENIAFLPKDKLIWVRNTSHLGKDAPFFKEFTYPIEHEGKEYWFSEVSTFNSYRWVRMRVDLALQRTYLWKQINTDTDSIPEWLTEFYLMEDQLKYLEYPSKLPKKLKFRSILGKFITSKRAKIID